MLWVISQGINPHTKFMKMRKAKHRKSNTNTETYVENTKGKKLGEGERFHYNNDYYNDDPLVC